MTPGEGLTVITGETGAGKSTLVAALRVLAGERFPSGMALREGRSSYVEGTFEVPEVVLRWWQAMDVEAANPVIIRRQRLPSGRTRTFVNDQPVSLRPLQEMPEMLLDIHSQHASLWLRRPEFHLEVLDAFAGSEDLLETYRVRYRRYRSLLAEREQLQNVPAGEDADYVRFLHEELSRVNLDPEAFREMEEALRRAEHHEQIMQWLRTARELLTETEGNISAQLGTVEEALAEAVRYDERLEEMRDVARSAARQLQELERQIDHYATTTDIDEGELMQWRQWRDEVYRLMLKHRVQEVEDLLRKREALAQRLEVLEGRLERLAEVEKQLKETKAQLEAAAQQLSKYRQAHCEPLERRLETLLSRLAMTDAVVRIKPEPLSDFGPLGKDRIRFLFSANKGMPPAPLEKTASGGEVSRFMLALKYVLSQRLAAGTLVLDEIDAGISGNAAAAVAGLIKEMARHQQVIVVSHSPQTAALPGTHLHVEKRTEGGRVVAHIRRLSDEERIEEIARLIAGERRTAEARSVAAQLLERGRESRE